MVTQQPPEWDLPDPVQIDREFLSAFSDYPVIAEVLHRRGYTTLSDAQAFLDDANRPPADPFDFPQMQEAVDLLLRHIHTGSRIAICGDYDTDGLTATAILYEGLSVLSPNVQFFVPDRNRSSHGITTETVQELHALGIAILITCDTGVSENKALTLARTLGLDVIITDHHTPPEIPAPANATINPVDLPEGHPMATLSGAGVACEFLRAVYRMLGMEERWAELYDLAAIGLVSDLAPLTGEARWLVQRGIKSLRTGQRPGLAELLGCANILPEQVTEQTISHLIAPRINSLSLMYDGGLVIDLLTTRDAQRAQTLAPLAEQANTNRKQLTDTILMAAEAAITNDRSVLDKPLLYLENSQWHYSVLGLVANQMADRYKRPTVIVSSFDAITARGSARSVPGMDITALISANADLLDRYGGHAMAAGFSIRKERLPDFRRALMASVSQFLQQNTPEAERITVDAVLPLWELSRPGFVELLQQFRPFGLQNPPLQFLAENLYLLESVPIGRNQNHRRISCSTQKLSRHSIVWWNSVDLPLPPEQFDLIYQVSVSRVSISRVSESRADRPADFQIQLIAFRAHDSSDAAQITRNPRFEVVDWRDAAGSMQEIQQRLVGQPCTIFAEGIESPHMGFSVSDRFEVDQCDTLVLLTCPAGYEVLRDLLKKTAPQKIFVIGMQTALDQKTALMQRITETILTSFRSGNGRVNVPSLAATTGQPERTIRLAIDWLVKKTTLRVVEKTGPEIILDRSGNPSEDEHQALDDLERALEETLAFKRFFQKADLKTLVLNLELDTQ